VSALPRSTQVYRGRLTGPAQTARQVRSITVQVDQLGPGILRLSHPHAPGWSGVARNPQQLAALVAAAFTEAQISAHAWWKNQPYEAPDGYTYRRPQPKASGRRRDIHDPRAWTVTADGRWRDPGSGRLWGPDTQVVQRVQQRRLLMGLPAVPAGVPEGDCGEQ
jgi:hypothetical protein